MQSLTPSDKYAVAASIALLILVLFDNAILMLEPVMHFRP